MRADLLSLLLRPTAPPLALGLVVAALLIAAETLLVHLLQQVAPGNVFGVVFLLGILLVSTVWGFGLGAMTSLASAVVYVYFHHLQTRGSIVSTGTQNWVAVTVFLVVALSANILAAGARSRAAEADQRRREVEASHDELSVLAEHQAALRRVATLVARGVTPAELFSAVAGELARCLGVYHHAVLFRYEPDGAGVLLAAGNGDRGQEAIPVGERFSLEGESVAAMVFRTALAARMVSYENAAGSVGERFRDLGLRTAVGAPIIVEGHLWGAAIIGSTKPDPLPPDTEARVGDFTDLVATAIANAQTRAELSVLAEQQAALRRVATLIARGVPPSEVFSAVAGELARCLGVHHSTLFRYEPDGTATLLAARHEPAPKTIPIGKRFSFEGDNIAAMVYDTGRTARIDSHDDAAGLAANWIRQIGIRSAVGAPIIVESRLWGVAIVGSSRPEPLPPDTEARVGDFTELLATAIANAASREAVRRLADEQAALRRVATLVAQGVRPAEIFSAVSEEVDHLFGLDEATVGRFDPDGPAFIVLGAAKGVEGIPIGSRWELNDLYVSSKVFRTGRSARVDASDLASIGGPTATTLRRLRLISQVGSPIIVEGRLWGALTVVAGDESLPLDTEERLEKFAELAATAIANADSRSELAASRRRIVAAADEARRRIERNLHDGTQQRLVSLGLAVRAAEARLPPDSSDLRSELSRIATGLTDAVAELQEISRGIHPAILSHGGLAPALRTLARRSTIPVELDVTTNTRFPEPIEVAAYFVASEALANATKHAQASCIELSLTTSNGTLQLSIRDDGVGGADPARGSGLVGLTDRVEALGGSIQVRSGAGHGTQITSQLPLELELAKDAD